MKRLAVLFSVLLLLAGCSGVPTSSGPQTVESIDIDDRDQPTRVGPAPNADARTIVSSFLAANAYDPADHGTARKYLTAAASRQWTDGTATIISNNISVSTVQDGVVTVRGRLVGSLNRNGVYTPQLQGTGDGGPSETFRYRIGTVSGQNRIAALPAGLVLTTDQFAASYRLRPLYFFDQGSRYLVPDSRWTALQGSQLNAWLVGQLASGPRPELAATLSNDTLPGQANARRITASSGVPARVEIPGAAQLDARGKRLLAAQVAATITDPTSDETVELTDGGSPVSIPQSGRVFTAREAAYAYTPVPPAADVFFLRGGRVQRDPGKALGGKLGAATDLDSIAVTQPAGSGDYTVAGVTGLGVSGRLELGTAADGYRQTTVRGQLSRPAWAPSSPPGATAVPSEVWVGAGDSIRRVVVSGNRAVSVSTVANNANAAGGRVVALRLSPEGSRVALVIESGNAARRLYIGSIVRGAGQVRIDALPAISPDGVSVNDVGWIGSQKLIAIGSTTGGGDPQVFETNVDGSFWSGRRAGDPLPDAPDSLAVAVSQLAWVSTAGTVWKQAGRGWTSPDGEQSTSGTDPVYLE